MAGKDVTTMKNLIAIIVGAVVGSAVLLIVGSIANAIQPTPPEMMDPDSPEAVAERVAAATKFTWISTIVGLALGAFVGGFIGGKIAKEMPTKVSLGIGLLLATWAFYTFYIVYPAVLWVPIVMLISVFLFAYLGGSMVVRQN